MLHIPPTISTELVTIGKKQAIPVNAIWVHSAKPAPLSVILENANIPLTASESALQRKVVTTCSTTPSSTTFRNMPRTGWRPVAFSKSAVWLHHTDIGFWPISVARFAGLSQKGSISSLQLIFAIFDDYFDLFEFSDIENVLQEYQLKEQTCVPLEQLSTMAAGTVFKIHAFSYMLISVDSAALQVLNLSNGTRQEIALSNDVKNVAGMVIRTQQIGALLPGEPLTSLANLIKQMPLTISDCLQALPTAIAEYLSAKKNFILSVVDTKKETPTYVNLTIVSSRKQFQVYEDYDAEKTLSFKDTVSLTNHIVQQYIEEPYTGMPVEEAAVDIAFIRRF